MVKVGVLAAEQQRALQRPRSGHITPCSREFPSSLKENPSAGKRLLAVSDSAGCFQCLKHASLYFTLAAYLPTAQASVKVTF